MSAPLLLTVAVAGGAGSALRLLVDTLLAHATARRRFPIGTNIINVTGSFALGLVTGLAITGHLTAEWAGVLSLGLLGGYTTFSTASLETVRLLADHRTTAAGLNGLAALALSVLAAGFGLSLTH